MNFDIDLKKTISHLEICLDDQGYLRLGYNYGFYCTVNWLNSNNRFFYFALHFRNILF